jgi:hypothetical protein
LAKNEFSLREIAFNAEKGRLLNVESEQIQESSSHSGKHTRERQVCLLKTRKSSRGAYNLKSVGCRKGRVKIGKEQKKESE